MSINWEDEDSLPALLPQKWVATQLGMDAPVLSYRLRQLGKKLEFDPLDGRKRLVHKEDYLALKAMIESRGE